MHVDPIMPLFVSIVLVMTVVAIVARIIKQPLIIGYLITGFFIGPQGLGIVSNPEVISRVGSVGVLLLLFFIGMEVCPRKLVSNWKLTIVGTSIQILLSVGIIIVLGYLFQWPFHRSLLIGFVIAISSTAVILNLLKEWNELDTRVGQDVLGILLTQDLAIIPMIILLGFFTGERLDIFVLSLQLFGSILFLSIVMWTMGKEKIHLPFGKWIRNDHEVQVLFALLFCFGLALISSLLHLSSALGAFVGGILIRAAKETAWVEDKLHSLQVIFIALFFASIGMLLDFRFLIEYWRVISILLVIVILGNTLINTLIFKGLGRSWRESLYGGVLLSQIGEFSFLLAAIGYNSNIIGKYAYQITIILIVLTLMVSPLWIMGCKKIIRR